MEVKSVMNNVKEVKGSHRFKGWNLVNKLWVLFSIPFFIFSVWKYVEQSFYHRGIQTGARKTAEIIYRDIIVKATNSDCKTIFVEQAGNKVDLINIDCLQQKTDNSVVKLN